MPKSYYFAGWLIDGTGSPAKQDILICVEDGLISSLEKANPSQLKHLCPDGGLGGFCGPATETYPACTILPGLIDCHVHLTMSGQIDQRLRFKQLLNDFAQNSPLICERIEKNLALGIMALRDGGDIGGHTLMYVRQKVHWCVGVHCAGKGWRASGRYGKIIGRAPAGGLTLAESIKANSDGADHLKVLNSGLNSLNEFGRETRPQFCPEELDAAFRNARNLGRKIMVHANGMLPVQFAIEAGCDSIEHGFFMGEDNMKRMADRQIHWVPTAFTMKALSAHNPGSAQAQTASRILENQLEQISRAEQLGVTIAAGNDAGGFGVRHGVALAEELKLIMEAGFSAEGAICCATMQGARLLGLDHELGRLGIGRPANFIVVDGPPSSLPASLREVKQVCVRGKKI
ncbi:Amidohydrolase [Syntrophobacter sp. SbD1]|nr:Amidohydrolase [Syntrophobacter sp. SbD1]